MTVNFEKYLQRDPDFTSDNIGKVEHFPGLFRCRTEGFDLLPPAPGWIADIGSGGGWAAKELEARGYTVACVVPFEEEAERLRAADLDVTVCDMHDLPDDWKRRFDIVRCCHTFEHSPAPYIALSEFSRVLKPGGMLQITMPDADGYTNLGPWPHPPKRLGSMPAHVFCGSSETVIELIRRREFHLVFTGYYECPEYDHGLLQYRHRTWMAVKRQDEDRGDWYRTNEWWAAQREKESKP